jgi:hypothetical protein
LIEDGCVRRVPGGGGRIWEGSLGLSRASPRHARGPRLTSYPRGHPHPSAYHHRCWSVSVYVLCCGICHPPHGTSLLGCSCFLDIIALPLFHFVLMPPLLHSVCYLYGWSPPEVFISLSDPITSVGHSGLQELWCWSTIVESSVCHYNSRNPRDPRLQEGGVPFQIV